MDKAERLDNNYHPGPKEMSVSDQSAFEICLIFPFGILEPQFHTIQALEYISVTLKIFFDLNDLPWISFLIVSYASSYAIKCALS